MFRIPTRWPGLAVVAAVLLAGCATPLDVGTADRKTTPKQAVSDFAATRNRTVAWGGVVVSAKNLKDTTQLEVLGYPLDSDNRPKADAEPLGRFLAVHPGFLETADYKEGRQVTIVGSVIDTREGTVGDARYVYPVLSSSRVHLWPKETQQSSEPRVHFGIGIGIHR
jgi:outer membrane lipoprotein